MAIRGIVIYCINDACRKPVLRDAYLRIGSRLSMKCFSCGIIIRMESTTNGVSRISVATTTPLTPAKNPATVETDDDDDTGDSKFFVV